MNRIIYNYNYEINHIYRYKGREKEKEPDTHKFNIIPYNFTPHKFKKNNNLSDDISIKKEILRSNIIKKLVKLFTYVIRNMKEIKNLSKLFKYNKLEEYVHKWCWLQYTNSSLQDIIIPYIKNEKYNFNEFIEDFNYTIIKKNTNLENMKLTLEKPIIKNLISKTKSLLKKEYLNFNNQLEINNIDYKLIKIRNENEIIFKYHDIYITINNNVYIRLQQKFNNNYKTFGNNIDIDKYIFCLFYRYSYIDSGNQQLAIHHKIKSMFREYGVNFELFGSAINVLSDHYCSLFYDIEKYFGSQGNFFDIELKTGIYWCNPPYINYLMTNVANKIIDIMNNTTNIGFIITIPIWDNITQKSNLTEITRNYNKYNCQEDYKDYPVYYLLKPYIKDEIIIPQNRIPYFNYKYYKSIFASDTYMLIIYKELLNTNITSGIHNVFNKIIELDKTNYFHIC